MNKVIMPKIDVIMDSGRLMEWLKKEGEEVRKDDPIALGESEKATFEIAAPCSGKLYKVLVQENIDVPIGQVIAIIVEPNDDIGEVDKAVEEIRKSPLIRGERREKIEEGPFIKERIKISPLAKKLANEFGINIVEIKGTGPDGRIVKDDILRAVEKLKAKTVVPLTEMMKEVKRIPITGKRKTIAERMMLSYTSIPHVTLTMDVEATQMSKLRETFRKTQNIVISYNTIFIKAVAKALRDHVIFNSTIEGDQIKILDEVNMGLAVATDDGLVVPVIKNADKKKLKKINTSVNDLVERAKRNELLIGDVTNGTFTITNLGMFGVEVFTPIIVPGQIAILGIGKISDKPQVVNGQFVAKPTFSLSLSFDHRVVDGALGAKFLNSIKELIENPTLLLT